MRENPLMHALGFVMIIYAVMAAVVILAFTGLIKVAFFIIAAPAMIWGYIRSRK